MSAATKKLIKRLLEEADTQGWGQKRTKDGVQLLAPDGVGIVTVHLTESDHRSINNTIGRMRKYGFKWKDR